MSHSDTSPAHESEGPRPLSIRVREATGLNPAKCYQCGKCSAGCPMALEMTLRPHDWMRLVATDRLERIAGDPSIWICLTCETCTARCPNGCDPARTADALREIVAAAQPDAAPRAIRSFHDAFLAQVRSSGRMFELGMILGYKMRTGDLFSDAMAAPGMLSRGKLKLTHRKIRGIDEVRRLFGACLRQEGDA